MLMRYGQSAPHTLVIVLAGLAGVIVGLVSVRSIGMSGTTRGAEMDARSLHASNDPSADTQSQQTLQILRTGFAQSRGQLSYAFVVQNPDHGRALLSDYQVLVFDPSGRELQAKAASNPVVLPNQTLGITGTLLVKEDSNTDHIEVRLTPPKSIPLPSSGSIVASASWTYDSNASRVLGRITNSLSMEVKQVYVGAIAYDGNGAIIGAGSTIVDALRANEERQVEIPVIVSTAPVEVEMYAAPASASSLALH
jgi:hypothetical protein